MTVADFADAAVDYCLAFSASVTSWVRTLEHNEAVGGAPRSPHVYGRAVDVVYDGARPAEAADAWLRHRGLRRIAERDHDHLQPLDWRPDHVDP